MKKLESLAMTGFAGGGQNSLSHQSDPDEGIHPRPTGEGRGEGAASCRHSEKPENQAGKLRRFSDYSESHNRETSAMRLRLVGRNDGMLLPSPKGGFAYGCSEANPDSEQNEPAGAELHRRNSGSVEQIQDRRGIKGEGAALSPLPLGEGGTECRVRVKKAAFTLSEVLITLLIIGILAAVTIPVLPKVMPNKLEAMRRKTYHTLENTVAQMITDDVMYRPRAVYNGASFQNTEPSNYNGTLYSGTTKFCELFASALTKRTNATCTADEKTFTAADNVDWYLPVTDFSKGYAAIKFDVNGKAEPNCEYDATTCEKPDTFTYYVLANGRILEQDPRLTPPTYCIKTTITGSGTVSPSENYCGLTNGTYTLTAVPAANWLSNWANDKRTITIQDADATAEVVFTESPKACINLTVNCETGTPDKCGSYSITNGTFTTDGNVLKACNLYANTYTVTVSPKTNFTSDWQTRDVNLNGIEQNLTTTLTENKYCAILNVTCPGGGANICGTYEISGNGTTYGMDTSGNVAKNCALKAASYGLTITPNAGYKTSDTSKSFSISNKDWEGVVTFSKKNMGDLIEIPCSKYEGYDECESVLVENADTYADDYLGTDNGLRDYDFLRASEDGEDMSWGMGDKICKDKGLRLPTASELHAMWVAANKGTIKPFESANYWAEKIEPSPYAHNCSMVGGNCGRGDVNIYYNRRVRCVK